MDKIVEICDIEGMTMDSGNPIMSFILAQKEYVAAVLAGITSTFLEVKRPVSVKAELYNMFSNILFGLFLIFAFFKPSIFLIETSIEYPLNADIKLAIAVIGTLCARQFLLIIKEIVPQAFRETLILLKELILRFLKRLLKILTGGKND